jgi:hypothetical protein
MDGDNGRICDWLVVGLEEVGTNTVEFLKLFMASIAMLAEIKESCSDPFGLTQGWGQ